MTASRAGLRSWTGRAAAVVVCTGALVAATRGEAPPPARVELRSGGAWVVSRVGLMTLIDGRSAEVVARVDVGPPSPTLTSAQADGVGYALDGDRGAVVRVDPRTFVASPPAALVPDPSAPSSHSRPSPSTTLEPTRPGTETSTSG